MINFTYTPTRLPDDTEAVLVEARGKTMIFKINVRDFEAGLAKRDQGTYLDRALPQLTPGEREFLISGLTPEEFDAMVPEE